jgi:O-antigen/teichoic acid export membrane protein
VTTDLEPQPGEAPGDIPPEVAPGRPSFRSGMSFAVTSFVVNAFAGLVSAVVTARLYGVEVIGEYALVTAPWLLLIQFSNIAEQKALTRRLATVPARSPEVIRLFASVLAFSFCLTGLAALPVALIGTAALDGAIDQGHLVLPSLLVLVGYVVIENTGWNLDAVLSSFRAGRELFVARFTQVIGFPILAVGLHTVSDSVWSLAIATVGSFLLSLLYRLWRIRRFIAWEPPLGALRSGMQELPEMLRFAVRLLPARIAAAVSSQAPVWVLGATGSVASLGAYSRASTLAVRLNDASFRVNEILYPSLVERWVAGGAASMSVLLTRSVRMMALALLLIATTGGATATGVLTVFGDGFVEAAGALTLLLYATVLLVLSGVQQQAFLAANRPGVLSIVATIRAVVTLVVLVPGVALYGGTGAAAGILAGQVVGWALQCVVLHRSVPGAVHLRGVTLLSVRLAATSVPALVLGRLVHDRLEQPLALFAGMFVATVVYGVLAFATGATDRAEISAVTRSARRRLGRSG